MTDDFKQFVYVDEPDKEWTGVALRDMNNGRWRVLEPVQFMGVVLPKYYESDLYSVPWLARILVPKVLKRGNVAALFHDYIIDAKEHPRGFADKVFLEAMRVSGVKWHRRIAIHSVVSSYTQYLKAKAKVTQALQ